ncbi:MAG: hypothetical protein DRN78_03030 [Thermoproteota archaeon]|nr:MAG: hypothetical protein DRN78_03030 [Candidatus Korarchaeota archaeon]
MRCHYCQGEGTIFVENIGEWVCEKHFERYFLKRVDRVLRRVRRGSSILFGISGGKDSVAALHASSLIAHKYELKIGAAIVYTGLAPECLEVFRSLVDELNIEGIVIDVRDWGIIVPPDPLSACIVCGVVTRYLLNRYAVENGYDYVATGHNLDDMAYFAFNNLITHSLNYLYHQFDSVTQPLPDYKMAGKVKPLFWVSDNDALNYVKLKGLKSCITKCPHEGRDKQAILKPMLADVRKRWPPSLVNFVSSIRELAKRSSPGERRINLCEKCGYPTSGKICAFCRLREKLKEVID